MILGGPPPRERGCWGGVVGGGGGGSSKRRVLPKDDGCKCFPPASLWESKCKRKGGFGIVGFSNQEQLKKKLLRRKRGAPRRLV